MIKNPRSYGLPELWFVKEVATERGITIQQALTLIRKNSLKETCPYCNAQAVVKNSRGTWCEVCEKDIYSDDIEKGY